MEAQHQCELDHLLAPEPDLVRHTAAHAFRQWAGDRPIILMGAGNLGRRIAQVAGARGMALVAFADNDAAKWGCTIQGLPVFSPADAIARYPEAAVVICIWGAGRPHRQAHSRAQLESLGSKHICSFPQLLWALPELLPHLLIDTPDKPLREAEQIRHASGLWADADSTQEFVDQVRLRCTGTFDHLRSPSADHPQYWSRDVALPAPQEAILDGGAYTGDSLDAWLSYRGATFSHWYAVEPDMANRRVLASYLHTLPGDIQARVTTLPCALSDRDGDVPWHEQGTPWATSSPDQATGTVPARTIDSIRQARPHPLTFIKMDLEGAEPEALAGAGAMIRRDRPVLAICVYHRQNHLWRLPLQLHAMVPDYHLMLRPHNEEGFDLVCYGIPPERMHR